MNKRWLVHTQDDQIQQNLQDALSIHPVIARLLINRGITNLAQAKMFLLSDIPSLHNPFFVNRHGPCGRPY